MKIGYLLFASLISDTVSVYKQADKFINELEETSDFEFVKITEEEWGKYDLSLAFILTGGVEGQFASFYNRHPKEKIYLLTYGYHNSLAASMEILSYLVENDNQGEILHGSKVYINNRLKEIVKTPRSIEALKGDTLGVIGKPSDWLIASKVDYRKAQEIFGVNLIDIRLEELNELISFALHDKDNNTEYQTLKDKAGDLEIDKSLSVHKAMKQVIDKYHLDGLTIRCFDLLTLQKTTGCISLGLLNSLGITASCEGDVPALISMHFINKLFNQPCFQVNLSSIDSEKNEAIFAHCTIPFNMCKDYTLDTHFESSMGVGIKGVLPEEKVTIFKIGADMSKYYVGTGTIIENLDRKDLCRTQVLVKLDGKPDYFLTKSLGNHHLIILGDWSKKINDILGSKLQRVE